MANVYMGKDVEEFIFGENTVYESVEEPVEVEESFEELDACGVIECVDEPEVACYRIALENEMNYNAIMNAFAKKEYSVLESTGVEMVYEAADTNKFFELIKDNLKKFWAKVQGLFKRIMDTIASFVASNKAFVKKFKNADIKVNASDLKEIKGYKFGSFHIDYMGVYDTVKSAVGTTFTAYDDEEKAKNKVEELTKGRDGLKEKMRGITIGEAAIKADEFKGKLKEKMYGSKEKETLSVPTFGDVMKALEGAKDSKDNAKKMYDEAKKCVNNMLSGVKAAEKQVKKDTNRRNPALKVAKCYTNSLNDAVTIMTTAMHVQVHAISAKMHQDRAIAAAMVRASYKKGAGADQLPAVVNNSAVEEFDDVVLI